MIVVCKDNLSQCDPLIVPQDLRYAISESNFVAASEWYTINEKLSGYRITVGKEYMVYGIIMFGTQSRYLIIDDNHTPGFFPIDLFLICDSRLFFDWKISEYIIESRVLLFVGYPALCESYSNLVGLIDGQTCHIERFLAYKEYLLSNIDSP